VAVSLGLLPLYVLLVLAGTAVEPTAARRLSFLGLVAFALGLAAYAVSPGADDIRAIESAAAGSDDAFFVVNTALLLVGVGLSLYAAVIAIYRGPPISPGRALALLCSGGLGIWMIAPLIARSGAWRPVLTAVAMVGLALLTGLGMPRVKRVWAGSGQPVIAWPGVKSASPLLGGGFGLAALAVVVGPHVGVVFAGVWVAGLVDFLDRRRRGMMRIPSLVAATLVLGPLWWFMSTVAGPDGLSIGSLPEVPFSPAAERLVALVLGFVVWALMGLWPTNRIFPDGLLAPLGIGLWLRVLSPAAAGGSEHWQPLFMPLGVLGLWASAIAGRGPDACNALAFIALASEAPGALPAVLILGATGLALDTAPARAPGSAAQRLAWMLVALALPFVFEAGFRAQVIYTLIAGAGTALACWTSLGREPLPPSA
jgi:hypothetical protein